jgi:4-hydroxy-tetrahydrodipicolinate synthase
MRLKGIYTAQVTPLINDQLDEQGLIENTRRQLDAGVDGLLFLGSVGEASTISDTERNRVIEIGVRETKGKGTVIIGTGCNSTRATIERTLRAKDQGADVALIISPYYNKPSQEGIFRHFEAISNAVNFPIIVYNNQGRTCSNVETETLLRLAGLPSVVGVKEASGNINQIGEVIHVMAKHYPEFSVLSGDDSLFLPLAALGGMGLISTVSNLVPDQMVRLVKAALHSDFPEARRVHQELMQLFKLAFIEVNPVPIKEAMNFAGMAAGHCRLPLCELKPENRQKIKDLVRDLEIALVGT